MKNHKGPKMVCLYIATKSRRTKRTNKSRYCQISLKLKANNEVLGLISNTVESDFMYFFLWTQTYKKIADIREKQMKKSLISLRDCIELS